MPLDIAALERIIEIIASATAAIVAAYKIPELYQAIESASQKRRLEAKKAESDARQAEEDLKKSFAEREQIHLSINDALTKQLQDNNGTMMKLMDEVSELRMQVSELQDEIRNLRSYFDKHNIPYPHGARRVNDRDGATRPLTGLSAK